MGSGSSSTNDRVLLHRIAIARARSVVGFCDLLLTSCGDDAEYALLRDIRVQAVRVRELLKNWCCDAGYECQCNEGKLF